MSLFTRKPRPPFRWTEEEKTRFDKAFRVSREGEDPTLSLQGIITQRMDQRHAWNTDVESGYFGWMGTGWPWSLPDVPRVPFRLVVARTDQEYRTRDSGNRTALAPIGDCYRWQQQDEDTPDGFEIILRLDQRRHREFTQAIRAHRSQVAPGTSFLLGRVPEGARSEGPDRMNVQAYWLNTVPLDLGGYHTHPYARKAFE